MKCVKRNDGKIVRVKDEKAAEMVSAKQGNYCPKHEFRAQNKKD